MLTEVITIEKEIRWERKRSEGLNKLTDENMFIMIITMIFLVVGK